MNMQEDLEKFSHILKGPIFSNIREANGDANAADGGGESWSRTDALRENHVLTVTCDRCQKSGIYYYVHSYTNLDQEICVRCYNEMREAITPPEIVADAKRVWKATREYAAKRQTEHYMLACVTQPTPGSRPVPDTRISHAEVLTTLDSEEDNGVEEQNRRKRKRVEKKTAKKNE